MASIHPSMCSSPSRKLGPEVHEKEAEEGEQDDVDHMVGALLDDPLVQPPHVVLQARLGFHHRRLLFVNSIVSAAAAAEAEEEE